MLTSLFTVSKEKRTEKSIYDFSIIGIDGKELSMDAYKGKPILIVNTASKCGFTPQYEGLQRLHEQYGEDLVIIGIPANNFLRQEPGSNSDIASFCSVNYGVTFTMTGKVSVKGKDIHPMVQWLTEQENPDFTGSIKWNFEKFLVDKDGKLARRFRSKTEPQEEEFLKAIKDLMGQ